MKRTNKYVPLLQNKILPPGTPNWMSIELIEKTLKVWQPRYPFPLTVEDAIEILRTVGRLGDLLQGEGT